MKRVVNWEKASVVDIESDGLLDTITKLHIVGIKLHGKNTIVIKGDNHDRIKSMLQYHIDNKIPIVGHNFIGYDVPALEKVLGVDLKDLLVIDTLVLSWYLNVDERFHSIERLIEGYDTDVEKYHVDDTSWENLSWEDAVARVTSDVEANNIIWEDFKERLVDMYSLSKRQIDNGSVGGKRVSNDEELYIDSLKGISVEQHISNILSFLMFKMDCARLQEKTMWEVDVDYLKESEQYLLGLIEEATTKLESVMPPVPRYAARKPPTRPFKKNGELSAAGQRWESLKDKLKSEEVDEWGNPLAKVVKEGEIHELVGLNNPNIGSVQQVKDFLFSKGWEPENYNYVRDKDKFQDWINSRPEEGSPRNVWSKWLSDKPVDRKVEQISVDVDGTKELCPSVLRLAEEVPEVRALDNYTTIRHRLGVVQGFLENLKNGKFLQARIGGFTNTLRMQHREIVNLPKSDRAYAESIRGSLIAGKGKISIGSDLSGVEDRVKHHFMIPHDFEYVKDMMAPDYDPHIATALASGSITEEEATGYKNGTLSPNKMAEVSSKRALGKTVNYASVYGAGAVKISLTAGISVDEAQKALDGYWELNKSVISISKEQVVIECARGLKWLINPLNGFLYSLRTEKDIFSTLAQGTAAFLFDMWLNKIINKMFDRWGAATLTAQMHDELVIVCRNDGKTPNIISKMISDSIEEVSKEFKLRRELGCDVQFGKRYSEIH